ncbi:MAG: hypothetical protein WCY58_11315 [Mariniphaga sp.]|nr:hypothetical protein [Mariniphaga sp.]
MKKKLRILIGTVITIVLILFNMTVVDQADKHFSLKVAQSVSFADAEDPPGDIYFPCYLGDILPGNSRVGVYAFWCGNCQIVRIWPESDGTCRLW